MSENLLAWQIALASLDQMLVNKKLSKSLASAVRVKFFECQLGQIALEIAGKGRSPTQAKFWLSFKPDVQSDMEVIAYERGKTRFGKLNIKNSKLGEDYPAWSIVVDNNNDNRYSLIASLISSITGDKFLNINAASGLKNADTQDNAISLIALRTISSDEKDGSGKHQITNGSTEENIYDLELLEDIAAIEDDEDDVPAEKQELKNARRGQGKFRKNTTAIWGGDEKCAVTGLQIPALLNASHIKPWRDCDSKREKLSGCNGILLCVHLDRLFDRYLIGFEKTSMSSPRVRSLICSPKLKSKFSLLGIIGITGSLNLDLSMIEGSNLVELEKNLDIHLAKVQLEI